MAAGTPSARTWASNAVGPHLGTEALAYDRRGFGEVAPGPAVRTLLDDLLEVLAGLGRPAWLVGNSRGGIALDAALAVPDAVAGLVLVGTAVTGIDYPDVAGHDLDDPQTDMLEQRAPGGPLEDRVCAHLHLWRDGPREPESRVGGAPRSLLGEMLATVLSHGLPQEAGESPVAGVVVKRVPGARHVRLPGTAHLPSVDAPQRVVELVRSALQAG